MTPLQTGFLNVLLLLPFSFLIISRRFSKKIMNLIKKSFVGDHSENDQFIIEDSLFQKMNPAASEEGFLTLHNVRKSLSCKSRISIFCAYKGNARFKITYEFSGVDEADKPVIIKKHVIERISYKWNHQKSQWEIVDVCIKQ